MPYTLYKIFLFYGLMGVATAIWVASTLHKDPNVAPEDRTLARILAIPWCLCLWPVEFFSFVVFFLRKVFRNA